MFYIYDEDFSISEIGRKFTFLPFSLSLFFLLHVTKI